MADMPNGATGPDDQSPDKPKSSAFGFFATKTGKIVLAAVLLFVVLAALGAIGFFFMLGGSSQTPSVPVSTPAATNSPQETATVPPTNPPEVPLDETFTFRNIFAPTVSPPNASTTSESSSDSGSSGSGSSSDGSTSSEQDTLVLTKITNESGEYVATFTWNGQTYEVKEGQQVDDSPWKVVSISSDSVVMLYGDTKVTLSVGEGFSGSASPTK